MDSKADNDKSLNINSTIFFKIFGILQGSGSFIPSNNLIFKGPTLILRMHQVWYKSVEGIEIYEFNGIYSGCRLKSISIPDIFIRIC